MKFEIAEEERQKIYNHYFDKLSKGSFEETVVICVDLYESLIHSNAVVIDYATMIVDPDRFTSDDKKHFKAEAAFILNNFELATLNEELKNK